MHKDRALLQEPAGRCRRAAAPVPPCLRLQVCQQLHVHLPIQGSKEDAQSAKLLKGRGQESPLSHGPWPAAFPTAETR